MIKLDYKVVIAAGVVAVVGYFLMKREVGAAVGAVGEAINPLSSQNIFYRGVSGVFDSIAGDGQKIPLGSRLYDWINPPAPLNPPKTGGASGSW